MCNIFTKNILAFNLKSLVQFPRAISYVNQVLSLPLCNTVETFVFSIMTHLKSVPFNAVGTYSAVVYLLNCYGTLTLQPSNQAP